MVVQCCLLVRQQAILWAVGWKWAFDGQLAGNGLLCHCFGKKHASDGGSLLVDGCVNALVNDACASWLVLAWCGWCLFRVANHWWLAGKPWSV